VSSLFISTNIESIVTRLYKASDPGVGFSAAKFHSLCDNKGPTLTLIQTTAGQILVASLILAGIQADRIKMKPIHLFFQLISLQNTHFIGTRNSQ